MIRIGCRAHDYGKHTPVQLAHILHTAGILVRSWQCRGRLKALKILHRSQMHSFPQFFQAFDAEDIENHRIKLLHGF